MQVIGTFDNLDGELERGPGQVTSSPVQPPSVQAMHNNRPRRHRPPRPLGLTCRDIQSDAEASTSPLTHGLRSMEEAPEDLPDGDLGISCTHSIMRMRFYSAACPAASG